MRRCERGPENHPIARPDLRCLSLWAEKAVQVQAGNGVIWEGQWMAWGSEAPRHSSRLTVTKSNGRDEPVVVKRRQGPRDDADGPLVRVGLRPQGVQRAVVEGVAAGPFVGFCEVWVPER